MFHKNFRQTFNMFMNGFKNRKKLNIYKTEKT